MLATEGVRTIHLRADSPSMIYSGFPCRRNRESAQERKRLSWPSQLPVPLVHCQPPAVKKARLELVLVSCLAVLRDVLCDRGRIGPNPERTNIASASPAACPAVSLLRNHAAGVLIIESDSKEFEWSSRAECSSHLPMPRGHASMTTSSWTSVWLSRTLESTLGPCCSKLGRPLQRSATL